MSEIEREWQSGHTRIVIFTTRPLPSNFNLWREIAQADPEIEDSRPREGIARSTGPYLNGALEVVVAPGRVDLGYIAVPTIDPSGGKPVDIFLPDARAAILAMQKVASKILPSFPAPVVRLSIVAGCVTETASVEDSYKVLSTITTSLSIDPRMRDLSFRVNWKAKPSVEIGDYLNRITTFSAISLNATAGSAPDGPKFQFDDRHFASMELDINTPGGRQEPFESRELVAIFDNLANLAIENLAHGEVR